MERLLLNRIHTNFNLFSKNIIALEIFVVYLIELALKFSPFPLSVERKELRDAEALYKQVKESLEKGEKRLLELKCEKVEGKRLSFLVSDILAVQIYEKTAASSGVKRPGFSFDA